MRIQVGESTAPIGGIFKFIFDLGEALCIDSDDGFSLGDRIHDGDWALPVLVVQVSRTVLRFVMHLICCSLVLLLHVHLKGLYP